MGNDGEDEPEDLDASERRLIDPRAVKMRFSLLKTIARSAQHLFHACQQRGGAETLSTKLGTVTHALTFGQPVAPWLKKTSAGKSSPRSGKDYDAHVASNPGACYPNGPELHKAKGMADAIRNHPIAWPMIKDSELELELDWSYGTRACQSHLDIYNRRGIDHPDVKGPFIADLKTAEDGDPKWFYTAARRYHYVAQLAMYTEAVESLGHPTPTPYIIVVESAPPHVVTVMRPSRRWMETGRKQLVLWFGALATYEASGDWSHGYSQCVETLDLPGDQAVDEAA